MTVAQLKAHLQERGIPLAGALEKSELVELALRTDTGKSVAKAPDVSEHLLEC
jgi:hypothetical protein